MVENGPSAVKFPNLDDLLLDDLPKLTRFSDFSVKSVCPPCYVFILRIVQKWKCSYLVLLI